MMRCMMVAAAIAIAVTCSSGMAKPAAEIVENSIGLKLVPIPGGEFDMGSADSVGDGDERPKHSVRITKAFLMGQTEVTNAQWRRVMGPSEFQAAVDGRVVRATSANAFVLCGKLAARQPTVGVELPSFWKDDDCPVDSVAWEGAARFCRKLSALPEERQAGRAYRLPTEAEWEYACRAGSRTPFSFEGDESLLGEHAWYFPNARNSTHPVGQKNPNPWGLYDMHGNVWEWCGDWYDDGYYAKPPSPAVDPKGPPRGGPFRVVRGGSWYDQSGVCRSANRLAAPSVRFASVGFRVVVELE